MSGTRFQRGLAHVNPHDALRDARCHYYPASITSLAAASGRPGRTRLRRMIAVGKSLPTPPDGTDPLMPTYAMLILSSFNRVYAEASVRLTVSELEVFNQAALGGRISDIAEDRDRRLAVRDLSGRPAG